MKNLDEIKSEVERRARLIDASHSRLPTYGHSNGLGDPHIEVDACDYHYVEAERGHEFDRWTTQEFEVLLYAVFRSVTFQMACDYEVKHRVLGQNFRRILFQRQIELMSALSPEWAERLSNEKERTLELFPFDDNSDARVALSKELRGQGYPKEIAWRNASEKYPSPVRGTIEDGKKLQLELRKAT
jgi:hypothetical protein